MGSLTDQLGVSWEYEGAIQAGWRKEEVRGSASTTSTASSTACSTKEAAARSGVQLLKQVAASEFIRTAGKLAVGGG